MNAPDAFLNLHGRDLERWLRDHHVEATRANQIWEEIKSGEQVDVQEAIKFSWFFPVQSLATDMAPLKAVEAEMAYRLVSNPGVANALRSQRLLFLLEQWEKLAHTDSVRRNLSMTNDWRVRIVAARMLELVYHLAVEYIGVSNPAVVHVILALVKASHTALETPNFPLVKANLYKCIVLFRTPARVDLVRRIHILRTHTDVYNRLFSNQVGLEAIDAPEAHDIEETASHHSTSSTGSRTSRTSQGSQGSRTSQRSRETSLSVLGLYVTPLTDTEFEQLREMVVEHSDLFKSMRRGMRTSTTEPMVAIKRFVSAALTEDVDIRSADVFMMLLEDREALVSMIPRMFVVEDHLRQLATLLVNSSFACDESSPLLVFAMLVALKTNEGGERCYQNNIGHALLRNTETVLSLLTRILRTGIPRTTVPHWDTYVPKGPHSLVPPTFERPMAMAFEAMELPHIPGISTGVEDDFAALVNLIKYQADGSVKVARRFPVHTDIHWGLLTYQRRSVIWAKPPPVRVQAEPTTSLLGVMVSSASESRGDLSVQATTLPLKIGLEIPRGRVPPAVVEFDRAHTPAWIKLAAQNVALVDNPMAAICPTVSRHVPKIVYADVNQGDALFTDQGDGYDSGDDIPDFEENTEETISDYLWVAFGPDVASMARSLAYLEAQIGCSYASVAGTLPAYSLVCYKSEDLTHYCYAIVMPRNSWMVDAAIHTVLLRSEEMSMHIHNSERETVTADMEVVAKTLWGACVLRAALGVEEHALSSLYHESRVLNPFTTNAPFCLVHSSKVNATKIELRREGANGVWTAPGFFSASHVTATPREGANDLEAVSNWDRDGGAFSPVLQCRAPKVRNAPPAIVSSWAQWLQRYCKAVDLIEQTTNIAQEILHSILPRIEQRLRELPSEHTGPMIRPLRQRVERLLERLKHPPMVDPVEELDTPNGRSMHRLVNALAYPI